MKIGILALQGGVIEHVKAVKSACAELGLRLELIEVRTPAQAFGLDCIILPGGESTVLSKHFDRFKLWDEIRKIKFIFGTCAGAILLAKKVHGTIKDQKSLGLMDIEVFRNAYGAQAESFEAKVETNAGDVEAVFIRAPKIVKASSSVKEFAKFRGEVVGFEQKTESGFYLALSFHPELKGHKVHTYFLKKVSGMK